MQKIITLIEKNILEITFSFYVIGIIFTLNFLIGNFFAETDFYRNAIFVLFWILIIIYSIVVLIKKFTIINIVLIPFKILFFSSYIFLFITIGCKTIINNQQKYEGLESFILLDLESEKRKYKLNFLEKILLKIFNKSS